MAQYSNQKTIKINRLNVLNSKKQYLAITAENLAAAARNLNGVAFKLYLYLATNKDEYELDYSPQHFANIYGVSLDSAKKAVKELEDNRYIIKVIGTSNKYEFYEVPQEKKMNVTIKEERRRIIDDSGEIFELTYKQFYDEMKDNAAEADIKAYWNECEIVEG